MRVVTILGTRPEIIRLAPTLKRLEAETSHILVHTGQNYDYELNQIFFETLDHMDCFYDPMSIYR